MRHSTFIVCILYLRIVLITFSFQISFSFGEQTKLGAMSQVKGNRDSALFTTPNCYVFFKCLGSKPDSVGQTRNGQLIIILTLSSFDALFWNEEKLEFSTAFILICNELEKICVFFNVFIHFQVLTFLKFFFTVQ